MGYKEILQQRILSETAKPENENKKDTAEVNTAEISQNSKFFGVENINIYPTTLDFRLRNGGSKAIEYSYIVDWSFDPSEGITITTSLRKVFVIGRNLQMLYNHLLAHRVKYIQVNIGNDLTDEQELFVKDITIEEL